ncbi:hypothetical protein [Bifidobacterium moukalabense]|jgi:hypothetical protein|uniref:Host cell surface-exposed lipoprotein n=1 Tax=Bifidobacterium moukalabense DSM 27321 TaxID=1435051 RepID=W4NA76_9BIFI|nr:hypothetical protein [Bifidobacterium moukalabense]ETY71570.1 hypothetical protein BMOU_1069 [Bifidobacterium moukalabense DSM 27321]
MGDYGQYSEQQRHRRNPPHDNPNVPPQTAAPPQFNQHGEPIQDQYGRPITNQQGWNAYGQRPYNQYPQTPYTYSTHPPQVAAKQPTTKIPYIVLGVIVLLMIGMCVSCSIMLGHTVRHEEQALTTTARSSWCTTANAQPTTGLDSDKALREAERLADEHRGESRSGVCSTLIGEFDEPTATWALNNINANWGRNALRRAEISGFKYNDPSEKNDRKFITSGLKYSGFSQADIDYALAHWNETIGDGASGEDDSQN